MKNTSLYNEHIKQNAKMVPFSGYNMPISYGKIGDEYEAVRNQCGMFDVSHMGQLLIKGDDAELFLQYITINNIEKLSNYEAQYSAICNTDGYLLDDLIVFKFSKIKYIIIVNASNKNQIMDWIKLYINNYSVEINDLNIDYSLIALQGPKSRDILNTICNQDISIPFYHLDKIQLLNHKIILSRTGYTGELGYEIMGQHEAILDLWHYFINHNVKPAGLAVRDILRMEMKYCLYGNDINDSTNPIEAGLSWIIDFNKHTFIGQKKLLHIKNSGSDRKLIGFKMLSKAIPRKGYTIYSNQTTVGTVTSGTHSPTLQHGIGLGYIKSGYNNIGRKIQIEIRNQLMDAEIVKTPFLKNTSLHN